MRISTAFALTLAAATATMAQETRTAGPDGREIAGHERQAIEDLALLLGLRAAQRPALATFLALMRPPHGDGGAGGPPPSDGTVGREREPGPTAREAARAGDLDRTPAGREFYTRLDPHQRDLFDAAMRLRGALGGPGPGIRGMRGPGGPAGPGSDGAPPGPDRQDGCPPAG